MALFWAIQSVAGTACPAGSFLRRDGLFQKLIRRATMDMGSYPGIFPTPTSLYSYCCFAFLVDFQMDQKA